MKKSRKYRFLYVGSKSFKKSNPCPQDSKWGKDLICMKKFLKVLIFVTFFSCIRKFPLHAGVVTLFVHFLAYGLLSIQDFFQYLKYSYIRFNQNFFRIFKIIIYLLWFYLQDEKISIFENKVISHFSKICIIEYIQNYVSEIIIMKE